MDLDTFKRTVGRRIRELRKARGITQEAMNEKGFHLRHYQDIEAGRANLTLETIHRLSDVFAAEPIEFFKSPTEE